MAMCAAGTIALISAPQSGCSSITCAVCNIGTPPQSLSTLSSLSGKAQSVIGFYSYDNFIVTAPTLNNIAAIGTTACNTVCAPTANTYTTSTACSWIIPSAPVIPTPTGALQCISISANCTYSARTATLCYIPSYGNVKTVTINQLAIAKVLSICCVSTTACGGSTACACICVLNTPSMNPGETYSLNVVVSLSAVGQAAGSCAIALFRRSNGTVGTIVSNAGQSCAAGTFRITSITCATPVHVVLCAVATNTACANCSMAAMTNMTLLPGIGTFIVGTPKTCSMCTG